MESPERGKMTGREGERAKGAAVTLLVMAAAAAGTLAALAIFKTAFPVAVVYGTSMEPGLSGGNTVVFLSDSLCEISRGDVVLIEPDGEKPVIKRVIAMEGDEVAFDLDGEVYVNGEAVTGEYAVILSGDFGDREYPVTVGEGLVFVLGDNRETSLDSRLLSVGDFRLSDIKGKMILKLG